MSNRSAIFASALAASLLASANFAAMAQNAAQPADTKTADNCQSAPKGPAPAGSHWYFHLNRATKTKCWYLGEAKNKAATTATAQQQSAPAPDATADAAPPLAQPQPVMRPSVADARAELASPQAAPAPAASADAGQAGATPDAGTPADGNAPSSARWLDATSMARSNGTQHAASRPATPEPTDAQPQATAAAPAAPGAVETPAEKTSSSTEMLLIVMVGALALAGLVSALVFRLTRTRTPPYEIRDEWRAPWDSIRLESTPEMPVRAERPRRLSELPPRHAEPPIGRREATTDPDQADEKNRQITAMLQRLARSATN